MSTAAAIEVDAENKGTTDMDPPKTWVTLVQTVGFPIVACLAVFWFANRAIEYERDRMTPALEACSKAIETQTNQAKAADLTMQRVNETLVRLEAAKK